MSYKKYRLFVSRGWTLIVCSVSVVILGLMASCRSKKIDKSTDAAGNGDNSPSSVAEDYSNARPGNDLTPMAELPGDSQDVKKMIRESNALKETLSGRMRSVIYGPPEVMERRAEENRQMRHKIDSLDTAIKKARQ